MYHLVTCADGADSFYSLANNKGRSESMQAAKDQDRRTQDAWAGHPHHVIIDNRNTFEQKIERLISLISRAVGLPSLARKAHKYLVDKPDISVLPNVQEFFVEKVILAKAFNADLMNDDEDTLELGLPIGDAESLPTHSTGGKGADESHNKVLYSFIRKRSQNKSRSCGLTTVKQLANGEVVELKNVISNKVYEFLKRTAADPTRCIIHQKR